MQAWIARAQDVQRAVAGHFQHNLRVRVALGISLPIFIALSTVSLVHYWREQHLLEEQARLMAIQLGQVISGSLRQSMLMNDNNLLARLLEDLGRETIERAQIVSVEGQVIMDNGPKQAGQVQQVAEPGCTACHRLSPNTRPPTAILPSTDGTLRLATPIDNEPACVECHATEAVHLGILLVDVPLNILWPHAVRDLQIDLAISGLITVLITIGVYWLLHRLVVRRVEAFRRPLAEFGAGNFGVRLPVQPSTDEIGQLALSFNRMATQLEAHAQEERELSTLRQRAIVEERKRIARELHDGLAQVLGYINTKATAVRLLLKKRQIEAAETQLQQFEGAARGLFVDVREAILGLRMTGQADLRLHQMLTEYATRFSQLSDLPVEVTICPGAEKIGLSAETELQLLCIVQEALANVRKHAQASQANIHLQNGGRAMTLRVSDDGRGFDPGQMPHHRHPHFGLSTMRERAEAIGAEFQLESQSGAGTRITVKLEVKEY